jgi:hypothetical protein
MYELIGRAIVWFLWRAYGREIRIAVGAGILATAIGVAAYLANRNGGEEAA